MIYETIRFGDLYAVDSRNGLTKPSKIRGSGYKMINMGELFANDRIYDIPMELVPLKENEKINAKVEVGDLLFARQSLVLEGAGKCSIVMEVSPLTVFESHLIRVRLSNDVNPMFYYYYFRSPLSPIKTIVSQCAQAGIRGSDLQELSVIFPPKEQQDKIASILSTYDDLIENNQKQVKLLEETAQRLYKEWFVDLRFPGHEDTEILDGVPKGWTEKSMADVCDSIGGGTPSTKIEGYYQNGNIKWVTPTDITRNNSLILLDTDKKITEDGLNNSSAKMVPPYTILMTSRASVGYFGLCEHEVCTNQGFISCIPYQENVRFYLLYNLMNRVDEIRTKASGSTFLEISKKTFRELRIIVPSECALNEFTKQIYPLIQQMEVLTKTIEKLREARDRLLPKLMSGEIEV